MELSSSRRSLPQLETTSVGNTAQPQQMISFLDAHVESLLGQTLIKVKKTTTTKKLKENWNQNLLFQGNLLADGHLPTLYNERLLLLVVNVVTRFELEQIS